MKTLDDVRWIDLPERDAGQLVVMQGHAEVPFAMARVFMVRAPEGATRGNHAHRQCIQLLVCVSGAIEVECDDGERKATYRLDAAQRGLLVPPSVWARQNYRQPQSTLIVLCDRPYEPEDYIRDYAEFQKYRGRKPARDNSGA
ncbi:MAG: FdtA/QdtA family cupin domain-containing protein [Pseudomonadota bacterium]